MGADGTGSLENQPLEAEAQPPAPSVYPVARSAPGVDNVNTIDIFGERPFSV